MMTMEIFVVVVVVENDGVFAKRENCNSFEISSAIWLTTVFDEWIRICSFSNFSWIWIGYIVCLSLLLFVIIDFYHYLVDCLSLARVCCCTSKSTTNRSPFGWLFVFDDDKSFWVFTN